MNYHLMFVHGSSASRTRRYVPAHLADIVIGPGECWINGYMVSEFQALSAVESFSRCHSLPAMGVWDCTQSDGGFA